MKMLIQFFGDNVLVEFLPNTGIILLSNLDYPVNVAVNAFLEQLINLHTRVHAEYSRRGTKGKAR